MKSTFDIRLENDVREAAYTHLSNIRYKNGDGCFSKRAKEKRKLQYTPVVEASKKELVKLLRLNYPEFIGRFVNVFGRSHHRENDELYVTVTRLGFEDEAIEGDVNETT
jgi:hypothetical protein